MVLLLAVPAALLLIVVVTAVCDLTLRPSMRRIAVRNLARRRTETALVVLGSLLGTAIIVATFVVGDTITASVADGARTRLGPIDVVVTAPGADALPALEDLVRRADPPEVDGVAGALVASATALVPGSPGRVEPRVDVAEVDVDEIRRLGPDPRITGFDGVDGPEPGGIVVNRSLANQLKVGAGDTMELHLGGPALTLRVSSVVPELGVAGAAQAFVVPGTIASNLAGSAAVLAATPPRSQVLLSLQGGVFDSIEPGRATEALESALDRADIRGVEVTARKQQMMRQAERVGDRLANLFRMVGSFSVIAGVALLVNLVVMLAEERRSEMGMLRAVGLRRLRLVRLFCAEGLLYSLTAVALGTLVGLGVGWVLVGLTRDILAGDDPDLVFRFSAAPAGVALAAAIGLAISMATIALTSLAVGRMNIIAAIRDLPDPRPARRRVLPVVVAGLLVVAGVAMYVTGLRSSGPLAVLAGPSIAALAAIVPLRRLLPARVGVAVGAALALTWAVAVFGLHPSVMRRATETVFIVQGVVLVAAAVVATSTLDRLWSTLTGSLGGGRTALAVRLALAYPLARRFRSGLTVGMFSLVLFVMTLLTVLDTAFVSSSRAAAADLSAGFDLVMDLNPATPADPAEVADVPGVTEAAVLGTAAVRVRVGAVAEERRRSTVTGIDRAFLGPARPRLVSRDPRFPDDDSVWAAVLEGGDPADGTGPWVVASESWGRRGGPTAATPLQAGDRVALADPSGGRDQHVRVAAVLDDDPLRVGALAAQAVLPRLAPGRVAQARWLIRVEPGSVERTVDELNRRFADRGADARTFLTDVERSQGERRAFMSLLRGFLGLGLLIGIAGLAVVMIRAVRERRREIGMLRAMGFPAAVVRRAHLLEAGFLAAQGVVLGVGLGLITGWRITVGSDVFGTQGVSLDLPWMTIVALAVAPFVTALLATAAPASAAARLRPSVALRAVD